MIVGGLNRVASDLLTSDTAMKSSVGGLACTACSVWRRAGRSTVIIGGTSSQFCMPQKTAALACGAAARGRERHSLLLLFCQRLHVYTAVACGDNLVHIKTMCTAVACGAARGGERHRLSLRYVLRIPLLFCQRLHVYTAVCMRCCAPRRRRLCWRTG